MIRDGRLQFLIRCSVLAALLGAWPALALAQSTPPLQVRDVLGIREFADRVQVDLSPDGKIVAFAVRNPARGAGKGGDGWGAQYFSSSGVPQGMRGTDVYVTEVVTAKATNLTGERGSSWSPTWSPDGKTLAFFSDRDRQVHVWLWDRVRHHLRRLSSQPVRVYFGFEGIRWSPNGRKILVKLAPAGMSRARLERLLLSSPTPSGLSVTPDSNGVTARVFAATESSDSVQTTPAVDLDSTPSFLNVELADLATIDVSSGRVRRIAPHVRAMGWRWAPDGARVAFTTRQPDGGRGLLVYDNYDLFVVDTSGKQQPRVVATRMVQSYGLGFSWSPRGRSLAFESGGGLNVVSREGGEVRRLATGDRSFAHEYRAPLWLNEETLVSASGDTIWKIVTRPPPSGTGGGASDAVPLATPADRHLLEIVAPASAQRITRNKLPIALVDPVTKMSAFRNIDLTTGAISGRYDDEVGLGGGSLAFGLDVSADGKTIAFVAERGDRPPEVWIAPEELTHTTRITNLNPQITRLALGATRLVQWTGPTGEVLRGALLMPGSYEPGKRFPLVVKVYGGARLSELLNHFGLAQTGIENLQLLATRGYAVLVPDAPTRVGTPMFDIAASVLPAVDTLIAMGIADPTRVALMGHSYGGYSVLAILVQTNRFKAAVSSGGFSNLFSQYGQMREDGSAIGIAWSERDQGRIGGSPWDYRDRYIENSPFFFLDRVRTPVLLLHGGADRTVLPARAEETFVALRRLGREVELVEYAGEEHHPGSWSLANATDYWQRIFSWFDRYLMQR